MPAAPPEDSADRPDRWGAVRIAARASALTLMLPPMLALHGVWLLARRRSPWARLYLRGAARACGIRVQMVGVPLRRDVFYVANHLSWSDIPVLGGLVDTVFIAQDKIADWPIIGPMARLNRTVFVSRTDRHTAADQVARVRAAICREQPVALFPEGTTTDGRSLLPFKSVLFEGLAPPPRALLVQPVLLDFDAAGMALAWIGTEGAAANFRRTLRRRGSFAVRVHFLTPFDPAGRSRKAIAGEARGRIAAALSAALGGLPVA